MSRPIVHRLDIYGTVLHLATDEQSWSRLRRGRAKLLATYTVDYHGWTDSHNDPKTLEHKIFVCVNLKHHEGLAPSELVNTVAHEAAHVALAIMRSHSIALPREEDGSDEEPMAYLFAWVTEWLWKGVIHARSLERQ